MGVRLVQIKMCDKYDSKEFFDFSLGLSWLTTKINHSPVTMTLENLQASVMGLGNANCINLYPCDIKMLNEKRK